MARVDYSKELFLLRTAYSTDNVAKARGIPAAKWSRADAAWHVKPYWRNIQFIRDTWPDAGWSTEAEKASVEVERQYNAATLPEFDFSALEGVPFKYPPMDHQKRALLLGRNRNAFAYFMEQGTGKTKTVLDDIAHNYRTGKVDAAIVFAPNSVKLNWASWDDKDEITNHMAPDIKYHKFVFKSDPDAADRKAWADMEKRAAHEEGLVIIVVNYEALIVKRCFEYLMQIVTKLRTMLVFDESTRIKKPGSQRSKAAKKIRAKAKMVRLLTGTPMVKSPLDIFNQMAMMNEAILGFGSYYAFRNHFCNMGGFQGKQVLSYKNLDELSDLIAPHSFRVTKKEALELPEKIYMPKRTVLMSESQAKAYKDMKESFVAEHLGKSVEASNVLSQIMRLQQITGGYITSGEDVIELVSPEHNPKFLEALHLIEDAPGQVIVWARFTQELEAFVRLLESKRISCRAFYGAIPNDQRIQAKHDFLAGKFNVMVANQQAGGTGQDWYTAQTVIYLSNGFSTEDRVQSEDRAHRKGTVNKVTYYDIVCPATEDVRVLRVIRENLKISDLVMDAIQDWL